MKYSVLCMCMCCMCVDAEVHLQVCIEALCNCEIPCVKLFICTKGRLIRFLLAPLPVIMKLYILTS